MSVEAKRQEYYKSRYFSSRQSTTEKNDCERMHRLIMCWKPNKPNKSNINLNNNNKNLFYEEFKPFWICLKLIGMLPYSINKNGDITCKYLSKELLYCVIFYALISIPVIKVLCVRIMLILQVQDNFDDILFTILMTCLMIPHTVVPYSHWFHMKRFEIISKAWKEFQEKYEKITGCPMVFSIRWKLCIVVPCTIQYLLVVFWVHYFGFDYSDHYFCILAHVYIVTCFFLHNAVYVGQSCLIIFTARNLKKKLKKAIQNELYDDIPNWTHLWFLMSRLVRYIGCLFNKMYLHLIVMLFCISTIATYRIIKAIIAFQNTTTMIFDAVLCLHVGKIWLFIICECGERVTSEVGQRYMEDLMDLKVLIKSSTGRNNVQELINTINQFPPVINFDGLVDVNRKLLKSIMITTATYLFVVYQFSVTPPYPDGWHSKNSSKV